MNRISRIALAIVFSIILMIGLGLIFVSRLDPVVTSYDSQQSVCAFQYDIQLSPLQTKSNDCPVLQDDWLAFSIDSSENSTMLISLTRVGGSQLVLFNSTGDELNASLPISSDGALIADLTSQGSNVSSINGSLSVMAATSTNATLLSTIYPYRTIGAGLVVVGAFALFLIVWNPPLSGMSSLPVPRRDQ